MRRSDEHIGKRHNRKQSERSRVIDDICVGVVCHDAAVLMHDTASAEWREEFVEAHALACSCGDDDGGGHWFVYSSSRSFLCFASHR